MIRPVDLQLAYLAGPQNAAVLSSAQDGPQAAQQAAAAAFAAEVAQREEQVDAPAEVHGTKVRSREEREKRDPRSANKHRDEHQSAQSEDDAQARGVPGDDEHFIDVMV